MRGRPRSARGVRANRATRPVASATGAAPTSLNTMATDSPFVLMASRPHRLTATVSGKAPLFWAWWADTIWSAARAPRAMAAALGMR